MCGLAGILSVKKPKPTDQAAEDARLASLSRMVRQVADGGFNRWKEEKGDPEQTYLGGREVLDRLQESVGLLKRDEPFHGIFREREVQEELGRLSARLSEIIRAEAKLLADHMGHLEARHVEAMTRGVDQLRDIAWCLEKEILENVGKIGALAGIERSDGGASEISTETLRIYKKINAVFNSIDRLEVRGRDSAGISLMFVMDGDRREPVLSRLREEVADGDGLDGRTGRKVLENRGITLHAQEGGDGRWAVNLTYKVAAEIGSLGDNIAFLRDQVAGDPVLRILAAEPHTHHSVLSHTRWASVGAINVPNCHPVDNVTGGSTDGNHPIIHVCLNGDIDNFLDLKREFERKGDLIPEEITTDTKIIPLQIETYVKQGFELQEAFRLAVNDFKGSHAIAMHTDLAPGRLFLAQKGSGQAVFLGMADDHYIAASEVYGFIEETSDYLKLDGEKVIEGKAGPTQGQIVVLDQNSEGRMSGVSAMYYDGTPITFGPEDLKQTPITSRDIDRQGFPHYFLKEISESPGSVEKTLLNRWKVAPASDGSRRYTVTLDESVVPRKIREALDPRTGRIRRIFFVGQGTAGVAAQACADILNYYMDDPALQIASLKASELSGFKLGRDDDRNSLGDTLVIAISQSGTTTDTNRTVDMAKERGALTIGIVNRRDSDLTFKVDGVMYTSSGRDIEMSVASTKAFYSQIVAGAVLGLYLAGVNDRRSDEFVAREIKELLSLPAKMRKVLAMGPEIEACAQECAVQRTYWAAVGSGPNKTSADEIRIKLSELCYKTISSDFVEDKKHIDLSSEPLIIVCAAGTRPSVIGDIIKDTAIFRAHKAIPIVIAEEGDTRFDTYAETVLHVPHLPEHLAPILNTLVGHIWGYYAALAINDGSRFLFEFSREIQADIDDYGRQGVDIYEVILEKPFREKIAAFYNAFRKKKAENRLPTTIGFDISADLTLLLKYLSGRLPVSDFELDFGIKGTALNMLHTLFACLGESINSMARPVDAIKHQAKTVTVGTSRIVEQIEGLIFDALADLGFKISQLTPTNIIVLKNLQGVVESLPGLTLYRIRGLNLLGETTDETTIEVVKKEGSSEGIPSRASEDNRLKGTKKIIVRNGNVYIGKGRRDDRSLLVIPVLSTSPDTPNMIEHLALFNVGFRETVPLPTKIKALGGKYEHIKNIVQENNVTWEDRFLELIKIDELFGRSAEKIGEGIVAELNG